MGGTAGFIAFVKDQLAGLGPVVSRRMFSGAGLYCDGVIFALILRDTLYFKVDDSTRPRYRRRRMRPFDPMGTPMNGYWQVPAGVLEDVEELEVWAQEAIEVAGRARGRRRA